MVRYGLIIRIFNLILSILGKINALGSLDECESEEEVSDEEGSGVESRESEEEEEGNTFDNKSKVITIENKPSDPVIIGIGSYENFLKASTMENFLNLGNNREDLILAEIKVYQARFMFCL